MEENKREKEGKGEEIKMRERREEEGGVRENS